MPSGRREDANCSDRRETFRNLVHGSGETYPLGTTASVIDIVQLSSEAAEYGDAVVDSTKDEKRLGDEVRTWGYIPQQLKDQPDNSEDGKAWSEIVLESLSAPSIVERNRQSPAKRKLEEYRRGQHVDNSPDYPAILSPPRASARLDLCTRCSLIQFDRIFATNIMTRKGYFQIDLGPMKGEWNTSCQVCCLFEAMRPSLLPGTPEDQHYHLRAFSSLRLYPVNHHYDGRTPAKFPMVADTVFLGVVHSTTHLHDRALRERGFIATSTPVNDTETSKFEGRALNPEIVDFDILKGWMNYCERYHTRSCGPKNPSSVPLLRVIDCEHRMVTIQDPDACRYLALSYVWGDTGSTEQIEWNEKLPETLPQVIEDAIILALKLGHRFLWVDRYCIKQNQKEDRLTQIHNMDGIYKNAFACIIAAAGSDSTFGLPGVTTVPRIPQYRAMVGTRLLVSTLPSIEAALESSTWATRAWTYQEGLLSRRRLIFTEHQVYYECLVMGCAEAVHEPLDALHMKNKQHLKGSKYVDRVFPRLDSKTVWELIADYSRRPLTKVDDALNAMLGIFSTLQKQDEISYQIWGIPIRKTSFAYRRDTTPVTQPRTWHDEFVSGLIWAGIEPSKRRALFPSWSWVGWSGSVFSMGWTPVQFYLCNDTDMWLESLEQSGGRYISIKQLQHYVENSEIRPKFSHRIRIRGPSINVRVTRVTLDKERTKWKANFQTCDQGTTQTDFHLTREASGDEDFRSRIQENAFTGIIVGQKRDDYLIILVVDWVNENQRVAERIGFFSLFERCDRYSIPTTVKEITLV